MRLRWSSVVVSLALVCVLLRANRALGQPPETGRDDIPPPRVAVTLADIEALKKTLGELKAKSDKDSKTATDRIEEALKVAGETKAGLAAAQARAEAAEKAAEGKAGGEKLASLESGLKDAAKSAADAATAAGAAATTGKERGDTAWMLAASALVMFMVPGLALFYGGMVRRKNVLATMMQSMAALAVVGLFWVAFGYALAFGPSKLSLG